MNNDDFVTLFDLSNIDWLECLKYATKSIVKSICDDWNDSKDMNILIEKYKLNINTIGNYLRKGSDLGLCNYKQEIKEMVSKKISKKTSKPVYCVETNEVFPSSSYIRKEYGIIVSNVCIGKAKTACGLKWIYVEDLPEDFACIICGVSKF